MKRDWESAAPCGIPRLTTGCFLVRFLKTTNCWRVMSDRDMRITCRSSVMHYLSSYGFWDKTAFTERKKILLRSFWEGSSTQEIFIERYWIYFEYWDKFFHNYTGPLGSVDFIWLNRSWVIMDYDCNPLDNYLGFFFCAVPNSSSHNSPWK